MALLQRTREVFARAARHETGSSAARVVPEAAVAQDAERVGVSQDDYARALRRKRRWLTER